ncbi:MAG: dockerin type I domain-containing protein [Ruminococcus sp.]
MKKEMAFLTALVMTALSVPMASVSAVSAYVQGDVDKDGLITGRDAAMVSMYADGLLTLTEEQMSLADVNADGTADAADAALIYENQQYKLGDVNMDGTLELTDGFKIIWMYYVGMIDADIIDRAQYLLADVDCDGDVDLYDAYCVFEDYSDHAVGSPIFETGKYYTQITAEEEQAIIAQDPGIMFNMYKASTLEELFDARRAWLSFLDVDADEEVTIDDAITVLGIYATSASGADLGEAQQSVLDIADATGDGIIDINDATLILTAYAKKGAGLL